MAKIIGWHLLVGENLLQQTLNDRTHYGLEAEIMNVIILQETTVLCLFWILFQNIIFHIFDLYF